MRLKAPKGLAGDTGLSSAAALSWVCLRPAPLGSEQKLLCREAPRASLGWVRRLTSGLRRSHTSFDSLSPQAS